MPRVVRENVGIPSLSSLGIGSEDFPWIAEQAVANGPNTANPQQMTTE